MAQTMHYMDVLDESSATADDYYTSPLRTDSGSIWSFHLEWSTGELTAVVQQSNKKNPNLANDDDWVDYGGTVQDLPDTSTALKAFISSFATGARWTRLKVTNGSTANLLVIGGTGKPA